MWVVLLLVLVASTFLGQMAAAKQKRDEQDESDREAAESAENALEEYKQENSNDERLS